MPIKAILVRIEYDKTKPVKNKKLPIRQVIRVPQNEYNEKNVLGYSEEIGDWQTVTHQRVEIKDRMQVVQLGYILPKEEAKATKLYIGPYEKKQTKDCQLATYNLGSEVLYYMPTYFNAKKEPIQQLWGSANEVICSGIFYVREFKRNQLIKTQPTIVLPAGMSLSQYQGLIEDLIAIHEDLVTDQHGRQSVVMKWEHCYERLKRHIDELEKVIKKINKSPETYLTPEWISQSIEKVKHFSSRTLIEKEIMGKNRVKAIKYKEQMNIYEHRMIKLHILNLMKLIEIYGTREKKEIESKVRDMALTVKEDFSYNEEEYKRLYEQIGGDYENRKNTLIMRHLQPHEDETGWITCRIPIYKSKAPDIISYNLQNGTSIVEVENGYIDRKYQPIYSGWQSDSNTSHYFVNRDIPFASRKIAQLGIQSNDLLQHGFFRKYLEDAQHIDTEITIYGKARPNSAHLRRYDFPFVTGWDGKWPRYQFILDKIDSIKINGRTHTFEAYKQENEEHLEAISTDLLKCCIQQEGQEEKYNFYESLHKKREEYEHYQKDILSDVEQKWEVLEKQLSDLLKYSWLENAPSSKEHLQSTPLFRKNQVYRHAYKCMRNIQKEYAGVDLRHGQELLVGKTERLYEYWCFIKMVHIFIKDLGFKIHGTHGVAAFKAQLNSYLKHSPLEGYEVELVGETQQAVEVKVKISFNKRIYIDKASNKFLTPDYHLSIQVGQGQVSNIYMDAKYRNYGTQTAEQWVRDVKNVAIEKYTKRFQGTPASALGSYIIHNDEQTSTYVNLKSLEENGENNSVYMHLGEYYGNNYVPKPHGIGAVAFLPETYFYFKNLIRLIMEYHFNLYQHKCWICGSNKIRVEEKLTRSNYVKYHVTCTECDEFWVKTHCTRKGENHKLIKHLNNYHKEVEEKDRWHVECPVCHDRLVSQGYVYENFTQDHD